MKSYYILNCDNQKKIADSLYGYYLKLKNNRQFENFWNPLSRREIIEYFWETNNPTSEWFKVLGLRVRDMSFTIYNDDIKTSIHRDQKPVIAKINLPVLQKYLNFAIFPDLVFNNVDYLLYQLYIYLYD